MKLREKSLALGLGLALAWLWTPALFGDEVQKTPRERNAAPAKQPNHDSSGGGTHHNNPPAQNNQSGGGRTYSPSVNKSPSGGTGGNNAGGGGGSHMPPRTNPDGSRTYNPSGTQNSNPPANPSGRTYNPPGNRPSTDRNASPTYNPPNRNPNSGTSTPGGNRNNPNGYNPGGNRNPNSNSGGYNPGNRMPNNGGNNNAGFNKDRAWRPPQGANASTRQGGGTVYTHNNAQYHTDNSGRLTHYSRPGAEARFGSNGHMTYAHFTRPDRSTVIVNRGPRGERTVVTVRPDRTRVVSYGPRYGYVERPLAARPGYISRTYVYGGRPYVRVYNTYAWRGVTYYRYVPPVYYHPVFYGWAFNPWVTPISFRWGWSRDPWYGYWGGYFTPAPVYPTAALWLTDYLLAENLRLAYESRQAALAQGQQPPPEYPENNGSVTLTPEVKAAIAEEVRQQIEAERAAAASSQSGQPGGYPGTQGGYPGTAPVSGDAPPPSLDPKQRIFVVSTNLDVTTAAGQGCALTPGDIILRTSDQMTDNGRVAVSVLSSKPGDCAVNSGADLEVVALQEMHNQFREQIDSGLKTLADNQGKNGLPSGPPPNPRTVAEGQAPADTTASVQEALTRQQTDASQAEAEIQQATNTGQ